MYLIYKPQICHSWNVSIWLLSVFNCAWFSIYVLIFCYNQFFLVYPLSTSIHCNAVRTLNVLWRAGTGLGDLYVNVSTVALWIVYTHSNEHNKSRPNHLAACSQSVSGSGSSVNVNNVCTISHYMFKKTIVEYIGMVNVALDLQLIIPGSLVWSTYFIKYQQSIVK